MPKYLMQGTYTAEGVKGILKEGGTGRRDAAERLTEGMGGTLEAHYFAFGDTDVYFIMDAPDNVIVTAASLIGNAAGTSTVTFTVLLTPEEVDQATDLAKEKMAAYRPPGQE